MFVNKEAYEQLNADVGSHHATLVAVSKTKSIEEIRALYDLGQKDFGENYVQELIQKESQLPKDIRWHFIGHLQSNKVKQITPFIHLVQSVDSGRLLREIDKQAQQTGRIVDCLLQIHIAQEETKFGLDDHELEQMLQSMPQASLTGIRIRGLMGMASLTDDLAKVRNEFQHLKRLFDRYAKFPISNCQLSILSMGMSGDYTVALEEGSTMVRIGSLIFGPRNDR